MLVQPLWTPTFRALAEGVGLHAEGGAEAFPVAEASRFGLFGWTVLHRVDVSHQPLAHSHRRSGVGKANALQQTQFLAEIEHKTNSGESGGFLYFGL